MTEAHSKMLVSLSEFERMPRLSKVEVELLSSLSAVMSWFRYRGLLGFIGLGAGWLIVIWRAAIAGYFWTGWILLLIIVPILVYWMWKTTTEDLARLQRYFLPGEVLVCSARVGERLRELFGASDALNIAADAHLIADQDGQLQVILVDTDVREVARLVTTAESWRLKATRTGRVFGVVVAHGGASVALSHPRGRLGRCLSRAPKST